MNSLSRHIYEIKGDKQKGDFFFFKKVEFSEIQEIMTIHSKFQSLFLLTDCSYLYIESSLLFQKAELDLICIKK